MSALKIQVDRMAAPVSTWFATTEQFTGYQGFGISKQLAIGMLVLAISRGEGGSEFVEITEVPPKEGAGR